MSTVLVATILIVVIIKLKDKKDKVQEDEIYRLESDRHRRNESTDRLGSQRHSRSTNTHMIDGDIDDPLIKIESDRQKRMEETRRISSNQTERDSREQLESSDFTRKQETLRLADTVENRDEMLLLPKAKKQRKPRTPKPKDETEAKPKKATKPKAEKEAKPKAPPKPRKPKVKIDKAEKDIDKMIQQLIDQIVNNDIKKPEDKKTKLEFVTHHEAKKIVPNKIANRLIYGNKKSKRVKMAVVNIGVLNAQYKDGDNVDIATLKEKGIIPPSTIGIKILASGVLDKALSVTANDFSVDAVKMLILTGGRATKL